MSKTVTLRLPQAVYELFLKHAKSDNRTLSNFIETATLKHLQNEQFVVREEMEEILANPHLTKKLREGSRAARARKGRLIG